jgi:Ca2+/Na+ antiporter
MVLAVILIALGTAALVFGGDAITRGICKSAFSGGATPSSVGLAFLGLEAGPLVILLLAAARGDSSFAVGIALGSSAYLIASGLGAGLMMSRRPSPSPPALAVVLPGIPLLAAGIAVGDGVVNRIEGAGLVVMFAVYLAVMGLDRSVPEAHGEQLRRASSRGLRVPALLLCGIGVVAAVVGAEVLLRGGDRLLTHSGLTAGFVGAALLGPLSALGGLRGVLPSPPPPGREQRPPTPEESEPAAQAYATLACLGTGALGLAALIHPLQLDGTSEFTAVAAAAVYVPSAVAFLARGRAGAAAGLVTVALAVIWVLIAVRI